MKQRLGVALLWGLVLLLGPLNASVQDAPVPWAEFVQEIEAAVQGRSGDQVVYDLQGVQVAAYADKKRDPALLLPKGVQLTIQNGFLEGMLIAGGDITLKNIQIHAQGNPGICFQGHYTRQRDFILTLEADVRVTTGGEWISALYADGIFAPDLSFSIVNRGTIESADSAGMQIIADGLDYANATVIIRNEGTVRGKTTGIYACAISDKNVATVEIHNSGTLWGDTYAGLSVDGLANRHLSHTLVRNEAAGVIGSDSGYGVQMQLRDGRIQGKRVPGDAALQNDGLISGEKASVHVINPAPGMVPLRLSGEGAWQCAQDGPQITVLAMPWGGDSKALDEEAFQKTVRPFLQTIGAESLPEEIRIRVQSYPMTDETPLFSMEIRGGSMPEP